MSIMKPRFLILPLLLIPALADAQILCNQAGPTTLCGGYDRGMKSVSGAIVPLGGGNSLITGDVFLAPRPPLRPTEPARPLGLLDSPRPSITPSVLSPSLPPLGLSHRDLLRGDDDLPPPPFPE